MAERRPSRQELMLQQRRQDFVGRVAEVSRFRENLNLDPAGEGFPFLYHVRGLTGIGKSTLVRRWRQLAGERGAVTVPLDAGPLNPLEAMAAISTELASQGHVLKAFDKRLASYRQRHHEAVTSVDGPVDGIGPSAGSAATAQLALAGLGSVPGLGLLAGGLDPQPVAQGLESARSWLSARLRNADDVRLVLSPVQVLTPLFLRELAGVARERLVVLVCDTYEQLAPVLDEWLRDMICTERYGALDQNVIVVIAGQGELDQLVWGDHGRWVTDVPLDVFSEAESRALLAGQGVTDETVIEEILRLSHGLPALVEQLAQASPAPLPEIPDPSESAVERFLRWETDDDLRAAALACALPLRLDEDVFRVLAPEPVADRFSWLRRLSFVQEHGGELQYHEVVRAIMLRFQRHRSPTRWRAQHTALAAHFAERRQTLEEILPADDRWQDTAWREARCSETHHRLCAEPQAALPHALREMLNAGVVDISLFRHHARAFRQAGRDTDSRVLMEWSKRLTSPLPEEGSESANGRLVATLNHLLAAPGLTDADRALAHSLRGRTHHTDDQLDAAVADFSQAIDLRPDFASPYVGRAKALLQLDQLPGAHADANRAVQIDPADAEHWGLRGVTHRLLGQHEPALADLSQAVQLNPKYSWAFAQRGLTHRALGQLDQALVDLSHAVQLNPADAWAFARRGEIHHLLGDHQQALADLDSAIKLNFEYTWAFAQRATTHRLLGNYQQALTDLDHVIRLDPEYPWALASRGQIHRALGHTDQALADLDHAIRLDPGHVLALSERSEIRQLLGHYEQALADLRRAFRLISVYSPAPPGTQHDEVHLKRDQSSP
ncbi:tetratricopeptide repeat protein [Streptomyces sp. DSM 44915]|uniref:Tetratricopeptide repeat protein n=1 Tax=Streptomyces chisholmiae TaxID=3075540 RepID=A0ABU2JIL9_9ACTN|nr:tetratricopeptide repeat protein [Streptomyces sp. DSM 44915]MDT0264836.1 tetratricopeptide repeat protein [Streptomyces sp. DSM 44915]